MEKTLFSDGLVQAEALVAAAVSDRCHGARNRVSAKTCRSRKSFQNPCAGGELLPHLDESADDKDAHTHSISAVQDVRRLKSAVFGKSVRPIFSVLSSTKL